MTRTRRFLLATALGLVPGLLLATGRQADASGVRFLEAHKNAAGGVAGMNGAYGIAVSPDGKHLYIAGENSDTIAVFARNAATGRLTFVEVQQDGVNGADGLNGAHAVAVSPDGAHVYVASKIEDALAVFGRDASTGALTFLQMRQDGRSGVNGLDGGEAVLVSPDGNHVYVAGRNDNAVAVFSREAATGMVNFVEMKRDGANGVDGIAGAKGLDLSPDGTHLYVAGSLDNAIAVFGRDASTGSLTFVEMMHDGMSDVDGLERARFVAVSRDGAHVIVAGGLDDKIAVFRRNPATGGLSFLEVHHDEANGVNGLNGASGIALAPNGTHVYVAGNVDDALAVFTRNVGTGALTYVERKRDGIAGVDGLDSASAVAVSPDGRFVYATAFVDDAVAVFEVAACGDGFVDAGEQCDDGNTTGGDCCAATCQAEAAGNACADDANPCTDDQCNGRGACAHPSNTAPCDDGAYCTIDDVCQDGTCQGAARDCAGTVSDLCREWTCNEAIDQCVEQAKACAAPNDCHEAGTCNPTTGACSNPVKTNGSACNDHNACTRVDTCSAGTCGGADPVVCTASDACHQASCVPASGLCENAPRPDGTVCNDNNTSTENDACTEGTCAGTLLPDGDGDGIVDLMDVCPVIPDPGQADQNQNGVGDACECTASAPGRCLAGGGPAKTDCLLEFNASGPVTLNPRGTKLKGILRCTDGDAACDRDGEDDGQCSFSVALCLANTDPRLARCQAAGVTAFEMMAPKADRGRSALDRANALNLEQTVAAMGVEIRRQGRPVIAATGPGGHDGCSALSTLIVPAPAAGGKPVRRSFQTRANAANGRSDVDTLTLECRR